MSIFDPVILAILTSGCKHEADIYREVQARTNQELNRTTVHRALERLLSQGLVARERVQKGRVYYAIEIAGRVQLEIFRKALGNV